MRMRWANAEIHAQAMQKDLADAGLTDFSIGIETNPKTGGVDGFRVIGPAGGTVKYGDLTRVSIWVGAFIAGNNYAANKTLKIATPSSEG